MRPETPGRQETDGGEKGAHAPEVAGAGSVGDRGGATPRGVQLVESEGRAGGKRLGSARLGSPAECRPPGSGKPPAQPEWEPRETLWGARVARDWLGGRGAGTREARTQPRRAPRQKQSPAEPAASSVLRPPQAGSPRRRRRGASLGLVGAGAAASWARLL